MALDHFSISAIETDDAVTVSLAGEIDVDTCRDLDTLLDAAIDSGQRVVLDVADVTFTDSSALSVLVKAHTVLARRGQDLVLAGPPRRLVALLELGGLSTLFHIEPPHRAATVPSEIPAAVSCRDCTRPDFRERPTSHTRSANCAHET